MPQPLYTETTSQQEQIQQLEVAAERAAHAAHEAKIKARKYKEIESITTGRATEAHQRVDHTQTSSQRTRLDHILV